MRKPAVLKYALGRSPFCERSLVPMPKETRSAVSPELDKAVHELFRAEVEFTKAYTEWLAAPATEQRARRDALDEWERRIEDAMHETQRLQDAPRRVGP